MCSDFFNPRRTLAALNPMPTVDRQAEMEGTRVHLPLRAAAIRPAAAERCHCLIVQKGSVRGRFVQLDLEPFTVGRAEPCNLLLPDADISRHHCQFTVVDDRVWVTDMGSSNGTYLNSQRLPGMVPTRLSDGALLEIGSHVIVYAYQNPREVRQAAEIENDLEKASMYIRALLPPPILTGDILTDWFFQPSAAVGGDAFGYQYLDENHFALYLVDVSGHGAAAALHTASVINLLRHRALPSTDFKQPTQVIASLNNIFQMENHDEMFFTMWYGVYDKSARCLSFSSAGQHPAYLVPPDRSRFLPLGTRGLMVGAAPQSRFQSATMTIAPGSRLYLFSDGVFEIATRQGTQWRLADFLPLLLEPPVAGLGEGQRLSEAVRAVARPGSLDDDFSMLVVIFP